MDRKNVTPKMKKSKNNSLWRKLGLGLVGGIVGGLLTAGIFYAAMGTGNNSSTATSGNQNSAGETVVENIKVNVDSDITKAVDKVQDAVLSTYKVKTNQAVLADYSGSKKKVAAQMIVIWKLIVKEAA